MTTLRKRAAAEMASAEPPIAAIRYMGSKLALLPDIVDCLSAVAAPGTLVVDPMGGSQVVAQALKGRHRLVTSDVQEYSAVLGRAFVDNVGMRSVPGAFIERFASESRTLLRRTGKGFLERAFGDTYLGARQCRQLDAMRDAVEVVAPRADDPLRWLALSALMTAACRAQASPGHFAQFLPPEHPRTVELRRIDVGRVAMETLAGWRVPDGVPGSVSHALAWDALVAAHADALRPAAAWYLDPPYTRDQYSRFYHFLETLARGDRPVLRHAARYREDRFRSAFCSVPGAAPEMRRLLAAIRTVSPGAAVVLSYSSRGLLSRDACARAAEGLFEVAASRAMSHVYSTQGKGNLHGVTEWLFVLVPKAATRRRRPGPRQRPPRAPQPTPLPA